jgi:hypothetical protein
MSHCDKETCWLNELPKREKKYLQTYLFAPSQPDEWKNNPNEWLSNYDILNVMKQYEEKHKHFRFFGPTPIDFDTRIPEKNGKCVWEELCHFSLEKQIENKINKIGIIFNLDKHDQGGSHWVSLYIDISHKLIFYFDSAANKTPKEIDAFIQKVMTQGTEHSPPIVFRKEENYPQMHQQSNTECGMYSLYFLITMMSARTDKSIESKIRLFKQERVTDTYIEKFRNVYFNPS